MAEFSEYNNLSEKGDSKHIRVTKGSYTDYVNNGMSTFVEELNNLFDNVLVIGSDVTIEIKSSALKYPMYGNKGSVSIVLSKDTEAHQYFLNGFLAQMQGFTFSTNDKGRPGVVTADGVNYNKGYLDFYVTKNFYEDPVTHFEIFCSAMNGLCQSQYASCIADTKAPYMSGLKKGDEDSKSNKYTPTGFHYGNLLSISVPTTTIEVRFGTSVFVRYHNVKFDSPQIQNGNLLTNEVMRFRYNFVFSYISFDTNPKKFSK